MTLEFLLLLSPFPKCFVPGDQLTFPYLSEKGNEKMPSAEIMTLKFTSDLLLVYKMATESLCCSYMSTSLFSSGSLTFRRCVDSKVSFEVV